MTVTKHRVECEGCGQVDAYGDSPEDAALRHERTCPDGGAVWSAFIDR